MDGCTYAFGFRSTIRAYLETNPELPYEEFSKALAANLAWKTLSPSDLVAIVQETLEQAPLRRVTEASFWIEAVTREDEQFREAALAALRKDNPGASETQEAP